MVQKSFHITDFTNGSLENMIKEVRELPEYQKAGQILLMVYEQNWDREEIMRKASLLKQGLPKVETAGITHAEWDEVPDEHSVYVLSGKFSQADENLGVHSIYTFLFFEKRSFAIFRYDLAGKTDEETGKALNSWLSDITNVRGVMLYLAEFSRNLEEMFTYAEMGYKQIPFFGAPAALSPDDGSGNVEGYVFTDDGCYPDYMVAVAFFGEELHLRVKYNFGWTPIGKKMEITGKNGAFEVASINNLPATQIYKKYLGLKEEQITVWNLCEFPLIVEKDGFIKARIPLYGNEEGHLRFACSIEDGDTFQFTYGVQSRILDEVERDSSRMRDFLPQGAFLIICGNRKILLQDDERRETKCYKRVVPELACLHGNAEIFRHQGKGGELNSALISVAIREGNAVKIKKPKKTPETMQNTQQKSLNVPLQIRLMDFMRAMTEDLKEAVREADSANRAKSDFLSNMSHEIRTPINAVLGMDEMILRESSESHIKEYAMDIQSAGNSLLTLINDILDLSKIESGKLSIVPVDYDLSSILNDLMNMIRFRAAAKNLSLEVEVDEYLPVGLHGDDIRIKQVITNILTNAVKYTPEGSVWFRVSGRRDGNMEILHFEVEDTGIGIKSEDMSKLFSDFERIEEEKNRNIEGTGLGMSITQKLLSMMDSRLEVESEYGKGSKFFFDICQEITDDAAIGDFNERVRAAAEGYTYENGFYAPKAQILVVDDNKLNLKVFTSLLKQTGVQITEAESGQECLDITKEQKFDIIFLDHMMPEMDGIETLHKLKADSENLNIHTPVFVLTANAVSGAKESYLAEGFHGYVAKPINAQKLEKLIRENLSKELLEEMPPGMLLNRESQEGFDVDKMPMIAGMDWNYAWMHLQDEELLLSTVRDFAEMMPMHRQKLEEIYEKNGGEADFEAYRIQVHSMKSVAATIGIIPLAGAANILEYAARDREEETIHSLHPVFVKLWSEYQMQLEGAFEFGKKDAVGIECDIDIAKAKLEMLKIFMDELDIDGADPIILELQGYSFRKEIKNKIKELKGSVTSLDCDRVQALADEIISLL